MNLKHTSKHIGLHKIHYTKIFNSYTCFKEIIIFSTILVNTHKVKKHLNQFQDSCNRTREIEYENFNYLCKGFFFNF